MDPNMSEVDFGRMEWKLITTASIEVKDNGWKCGYMKLPFVENLHVHVGIYENVGISTAA